MLYCFLIQFMVVRFKTEKDFDVRFAELDIYIYTLQNIEILRERFTLIESRLFLLIDSRWSNTNYNPTKLILQLLCNCKWL